MRYHALFGGLLLAGAATLMGLAADDPAEPRPKAAPKPTAAPQAQPTKEPATKSPAKGAAKEAPAKTPQAPAKPNPAKPAPTQPAKSPPDKPQPAADDDAVRAIEASAEDFVRAYNAHDAKALAACFAERAQFIDEEGELVDGRDAIEKNFADLFEKEPNVWLAIDVDSIRMLTPNVAIEEGSVRSAASPDEPHDTSHYVAVHIKKDNRWLVGSVRDFPTEGEALTPHDHLQPLAWMVGDWVDEKPEALVTLSCDWSDDGNFLLQEYRVVIAGQISSTGSIRIGWDPLARQIRSWGFTSDGGYSEASWTDLGDEWRSKSQGVSADGETVAATHVFRYIDDDTMSWRSYDRSTAGEPTPEVDELIIKRAPPSLED
jgi:uncharacterized protein (TIGR02246 family)